MAVLTESTLRSLFLRGKIIDSTIKLPQGTILTPAARSYLQEKKVTVEYDGPRNHVEKQQEEKTDVSRTTPAETIEKRQPYRLIQGGFIDVKPEYMTPLHTDLLVYKDDKRIIFQGKLDSFEAKILEAQWQLAEKGYVKLTSDLSDILDFVRTIQRSERTEERLDGFRLLNKSANEIQEIFNDPKKHLNVEKFVPEYQMGAGIIVLNGLRTFARETEISAYQALKKEDGSTERDDIILALNRLSSLLAVMMLMVKAGYYTEERGRQI